MPFFSTGCNTSAGYFHSRQNHQNFKTPRHFFWGGGEVSTWCCTNTKS